jgi:hypothetical protein|tara:strand:- start:87 stop:599 length:513 start_codon:yes stop_codon:yes gene_type:complete
MVNKDLRIVSYIDNFLEKNTLKILQNDFTQLEFKPVTNDDGLYGHRYNFTEEEFKPYSFILNEVKKYFFPSIDLYPFEVCVHIRHNQHKPMVHQDPSDFNFLLFLKGEPLLNNGTGFYNEDGQLSSHIGFIENRAVFFNGGNILHSDLQSFGKSSSRYTLTAFFKESKND